MKRLGVLLSGRGSNFQAIHRAILAGQLEAEIAVVISNVPDAPGLAYAAEHGLKTVALNSKGIKRAEFDQLLVAELEQVGVDLVVLAGYMRLLSPEFVHHYEGRMLNIHPSLLPDFKGLHAQRQALEAGVTVAGCTVHYVDTEMDTGPILMQAQVPVLPGDTEDSLSARILEQEHKLYPKAIAEALSRLG